MSERIATVFKKVGALVQLELIKVDDVTQRFDMDFGLITQWIEPERDDDCDYSEMTRLNEKPIWTPELLFYGTTGEMTNLLEPSYFRLKNIYYGYNNWIITFKDTLELERFPFDRQVLNIRGFSTNAEFIDFQPELGIPPCVFESHAYSAIRLIAPHDTWLAESVSCECTKEGNDSEISISMRLTRRPEFYILNIVFVNFLIVMISLSVYVIDAQDFASRLGILETNLLTAVAFKFVINSWVPNVSYLTLLDKYIILTFVIIFAIVVASFTMHFLNEDDANKLNNIFTYTTASLWIFVHLMIIISYYFQLLTPSWAYVEANQDDSGGEAYTLIQKKLNKKYEYNDDIKGKHMQSLVTPKDGTERRLTHNDDMRLI